MSSTNRSQARKHHKSDYYITPVANIVEFLHEFNKYEDVFLQSNTLILDPCAGGDKDHSMSYPEALKQVKISPKRITTIDIRKDSLASIKGNYLDIDCTNKYDAIITNPPFSIARDIIEKALDDVKDDGFVIMLLRLNYFGGRLRKDM